MIQIVIRSKRSISTISPLTIIYLQTPKPMMVASDVLNVTELGTRAKRKAMSDISLWSQLAEGITLGGAASGVCGGIRREGAMLDIGNLFQGLWCLGRRIEP